MADCAVLNTIQRRKMILGKVFNMQHELFDIIFKDSVDNKFNNFINLYERNVNFQDKETILYEVDSQYREKLYLQWKHGKRTEGGYAEGMRYPAYISYVKGPTREDEPHKIVDVDLKNMEKIIDAETIKKYSDLVDKIEMANLKAKLLSTTDVADLHDLIDNIGAQLYDEFSRYSWVGGMFWGGKGFSYWGDWTPELMGSLADAGLIDELTNTGDEGYHAQRLCSSQFYKPSLVTNYLCGSSYDSFKFCCPAFFVVRGERMLKMLEAYHKMSFVTTFKSTIELDRLMKWQDRGVQDIKLWEGWRDKLKEMESDIKSLVFMSEK